jgi:hypothetical protein
MTDKPTEDEALERFFSVARARPEAPTPEFMAQVYATGLDLTGTDEHKAA